VIEQADFAATLIPLARHKKRSQVARENFCLLQADFSPVENAFAFPKR
jgi:hypothetical protein